MHNEGSLQRHPYHRSTLWAVLLPILVALSLSACGDVSTISAPSAPAASGPLTILTSDPLPVGTVQADYNVTLAPNGGTPPYTWSLTTGSPALPDGLTFTPSTGKIGGVPTAATATRLTEFTLQDSKGQAVQKVLAITVNAAPTPLAILTDSLPTGTINQLYAFALGGTGGTTPYTWGIKSGSAPLPDGLILDPSGVISGTPVMTGNDSHIFTLRDATGLTVEKSLALTISSVPLSITTSSLPQGTANQNYSAALAASGGTGAYTWGLAGGSPALPNGVTLNPSTGVISGIPTNTSSLFYTFLVGDATPPISQTATRTMQLIIGAAPPALAITTNFLSSGTVAQPYNASVAASGGTGTTTWDLAGGSLPVGLNLSSSGVLTGTPTTAGTSSPTFRVRDSGTPQQSTQNTLPITINLPAAPNITTTSLPEGTFNEVYNQTVSVTGGIGTLIWGVTSGALPPGLNLNASSGTVSGTPTSTGPFTFTLRVTDAIPQFDEQNVTIAINSPAPPSITTPSLPTGTVNQPYSNTQLTATGGAQPYSWSVSPVLPNGLALNPSSGVISGTPLSGSNGNSNHEFIVTDSTLPIHQQGKRTLSLTIFANVTPLTITTNSLPDGKRNQAYARTLAASGGTIPYTWSVTPPLPAGLTLSSATGLISGVPTAASDTDHNFTVRDSANQTITKQLNLQVKK
ncbi:MAG: hypothetical protein CAF44_010420 [Nitrospira sp. CG24D]|nr:MAG: hypothetical protein CAF44_010420 [Nitrospira sp. CG24D]